MRLFFSFLIILIFNCYSFGQDFVYPKNFKFPKIQPAGKNSQDFVPQNWKVLHKVFGDVNNDKKLDAAIILRANYAKYINKNDDFGGSEFDTNPQMLLILLNKGDHFELIEQNNTFIIGRESPSESEPLDKIEIKNGVLHLYFVQWQSAGSWYSSNSTYKFRFVKSEFVLIGVETSSSMRNEGKVASQSYNLITKKIKTSLSTYEDEKPYKITWRNLKFSKPITFKFFKAPYTLKIGKDEFL